jgi:cellulose synthase/poly-beta-1,6-N-acetylglucosamine synthase-like glycosyltransferase
MPPELGTTLFNAVMALALLLLSWGFAQFVLAYRWGHQELDDALAGSRLPDGDYRVVFLIACLNEQEVIGATVREIRRLAANATVIVIDDASDDETGRCALAEGAIVIRRELPDARRGKGPALNHGYEVLQSSSRLAPEGFDPERTIVCVMDADGRLSDGAIPAVLSRFDSPRVGGVQLPVRIRNKGRFIGRMQDFEFWGMSAITQMARIRTRSVSLGGNGQFTRLAALVSVGREPWSDALTEDLDLALELTLRGWELDCAAGEWVTQQGVETLSALLRQRTRWYQGHMTCSSKVPLLWQNGRVARRTALETTIYLLTPAFVMLPWSIAFTAGLAFLAFNLVEHSSLPFDGVGVHAVLYAGFWYVLTFLPHVVHGLLYARRTEGERLLPAIGKAHVNVFYAYVNMLAGWRALGRILAGRTDWAKTKRVAESGNREPPAWPEAA